MAVFKQTVPPPLHSGFKVMINTLFTTSAFSPHFSSYAASERGGFWLKIPAGILHFSLPGCCASCEGRMEPSRLAWAAAELLQIQSPAVCLFSKRLVRCELYVLHLERHSSMARLWYPRQQRAALPFPAWANKRLKAAAAYNWFANTMLY